MRQPRFWYGAKGRTNWRSIALMPLSLISALATARRVRRPPEFTCPVPVICVGNVNLGGTGKTPTVIALVQALQARGKKPAVISRGHGGSIFGPEKVDPVRHTSAEVGDEPLLIAAFAPVWIAKERARAAQAACASGADVIVMDDGLQNPDVAKTFSFVVVDGRRGFGNEYCFPAGPLREPVAKALERADAIVVVGPPNDRLSSRLAEHPGIPVLKSELKPLPTGMDWEGARVLAFAGIGHPEKFFTTLRDLGAELCSTVALDDHQTISPALIARLAQDSARLGAQLVTTEKDAVRLTQSQRANVMVLPVRLSFDDPAGVETLLTKAMAT